MMNPIPETVLLQIIDEYSGEEAAEVIRAIHGLPQAVSDPPMDCSWPSAFVQGTAIVCLMLLILHFSWPSAFVQGTAIVCLMLLILHFYP